MMGLLVSVDEGSLFFWLILYCQYLILSFNYLYYIKNIIIYITKDSYFQLRMLKMVQEIDTHGSISELKRYNHTIYGHNSSQDLLEIDLKHKLVVRKRIKYPPVNVRLLNWQGISTYFLVYMNTIERQDGVKMIQSNKKAQFQGPIDSANNSLVFSKFHHNHKKYSINYMWEGNKKILKLYDKPIKKVIFNPLKPQIIVSYQDLVTSFDLNEPQKQTILTKKPLFLSDNYNLYCISLTLESKAKDQYECGIFDFRTGKNTDNFISKDLPIKIQSFARNLLVATSNAFEIYDTRKLIKPVEHESIKGIKDFLYEPNINKLYIGNQNRLKVYQSQY